MNNSRGAALIIVLFIATILGVMSALLIAKTKQHIQRITVAKEYLQAERIALSDLNHLIFATQTSPYAIFGNSSQLPESVYLGDEALPKDINLHNTTFFFRSSQVKIQDMSGLIPLISLDSTLMKNYLSSIGWPDDQVYHFLDVLEDWQDTNGFKRLNGAESNDYETFGYPLNQPLQTVKDLGLFVNISPDLLTNLSLDKHILQFFAGSSSSEYAPDDLLDVMTTEWDAKNVKVARDEKRQQGSTLSTSAYPSNNWIIHIESRYKQAVSVKEIHLLRRFGEYRPFVISYWQER